MKSTCRYSLSTLLALLLTASSLAAVAATNYYRWTDEQGNTIHSDRPPPTGVDYEVVRTGASFKYPESSDNALETETGDGEPGQAGASAKAQSQKDPELCARGRDNLDALTHGGKVTMRNEKGEVHVLTPEEIKMKIQTTRGQIEAFCE